jgi:glucose/arabinose dehydrogenase
MFVAALAAEKLVIITFGAKGYRKRVVVPAELDGDFGRLRTVTQLRNGNVLVATDADGGQGRVLLVRPS